MTYTPGFYVTNDKNITKHDIITLCGLLNNDPFYANLCTFEPEPITEGGIVFKFSNPMWYKTMRFRPRRDGVRWPWINANVMTEWFENQDVVIHKKNTFETYLKSFRGAPSFTIEELKIWETCLNQIGIRVGTYPTKKMLQ